MVLSVFVSCTKKEDPKPVEKGITTPEQLISWMKTPVLDIGLAADIDLKDVVLPDISTIDHTLDGRGHKITNATFSKPLIKNLKGGLRNITFEDCTFNTGLVDANAGTLSGINFAASCNIVIPLPTSTCAFGVLANTNTGTVENCATAIKYYQEFASLPKSSVYLGGLVGKSEGLVKGCSNTGEFSIYVKAPATGTFYYFGGIVAFINGKAGNVVVQGCTNSALVQVKYDTSCYFYTGGIVGGSNLISATNTEASNYGTIEGCTNRGDVKEFFKNGGSGSYPQVAGIISYHEGMILNCENYGNIYIKCDHPETAWTGVRVAGIAGTCSAGMKSCHNHGTVSVDAVVAGGTKGNRGAGNTASSSFAGVCCCAGPFVTANPSAVFEDCSNDADLVLTPNTIKGSPDFCFGGVFACVSGSLKDCRNTGNITVRSRAMGNYVGGVAGQAQTNITSCSNTGKISADNLDCPKDTWTTYAGGVCGYYLGNVSHTVTGCTNSGDVVLRATGGEVSPDMSYIAGVLGYKELDNSKLENSTNTGAIKDSTLLGCVIVGNVCAPEPEKPIDPKFLFAEGHILDNGGTPCVGISVSDGFRTTVTDSKGYYRLTTSADTRYIYYSIPNYAKIEKNEFGCPDYYKKFEIGTTTYDFTIIRQSVEDEFALFVLGDPQAHYKIKGTQEHSGTDRFLNESVPAINAQVAAQKVPCYCVTVGDIVYTSDGVNSNPGMPIMREHIAKLNMPVFQVMGNHDYSYKPNGTAISTDSRSSTINLVSQRAFEDAFGPINHSFDRGNVHIICMKNINTKVTTSWNASNYNGSFTDMEYEWLKDDLKNVPKSKMVILCVHVPFYDGGSRPHVTDALNLIKEYTNPQVFSGHTHTKIANKKILGTNVEEHTHNAVCGCFWYGNLCADGSPSGFTVYDIKGTNFKDEYFIGINTGMNTRDYQMRIYRGNGKYGGPNGYYQTNNPDNMIQINLFNGNDEWKLEVYENDVKTGEAVYMDGKTYEYEPAIGQTISVPAASNQDWYSIGWYSGILGRHGYCYDCFHMYKYTLKDKTAKVKVVATDPYGNKYTCTDIVEDGTAYPDCVMKIGYDYWQ